MREEGALNKARIACEKAIEDFKPEHDVQFLSGELL
jgi:hypothetical protein